MIGANVFANISLRSAIDIDPEIRGEYPENLMFRITCSQQYMQLVGAYPPWNCLTSPSKNMA
jgi:hypothetical protein